MGVKRGAWESVRRGDVWRQDAIAGHVSAVDVGAGLRAMAEAVKSSGEKDASVWNGWANIVGVAKDGLAKLGSQYVGIKAQQENAAVQAEIEASKYERDCKLHPENYDRDTMKGLKTVAANARTTADSMWVAPKKGNFSIEEYEDSLKGSIIAEDQNIGMEIVRRNIANDIAQQDAADKINKGIGE